MFCLLAQVPESEQEPSSSEGFDLDHQNQQLKSPQLPSELIAGSSTPECQNHQPTPHHSTPEIPSEYIPEPRSRFILGPLIGTSGHLVMASDGIPPVQPDHDWTRGSTIPDALSYEEHGRTFQAYKQDKYFLPNDAMEQDRLDMTHQLFYQLLGYSLYKAPISHPGRVLDIATGTGIWAIQFAEQHPESTVIGTDLSLIQPPASVPNVEFVRDDVEDNWVFDQPFDFVHMRLVFTCFKSHRDVINSVFANLNPGGYLEFHDCSFDIRADDGSMIGTSLQKWSHFARAAAADQGRDFEISRYYKTMMLEAGFVDVVEKRTKMWGNPWKKSKEDRTIGTYTAASLGQVIQGMSVKLLHHGLGLPIQMVNDLAAKAKADVENTNIHYYLPLFVVYGRKPFDHEVVPPNPVLAAMAAEQGSEVPW